MSGKYYESEILELRAAGIIRKYAALSLTLLIFAALMGGCTSADAPPPADSNGEVATSELVVDLLSKTHTLLLDSEGRLKSRAELSSGDGTVTLSIDAGTTLLSNSNRPLSQIQVEIDTSPLALPKNAVVLGAVYNLKPQEAILQPSLKLTLSYDPSELPEGVKENDLYIAPYDEVTGWGKYSYKKVDTESHRVITQIDRMTKYAILAPLTPASSQSSSEPSTQLGSASISLEQALSSGKPTLAEFGSKTCVPCKMMKPVLDELAVEYQDKLNVVIIEVYEQKELTRYYRIMTIPTQIVFDGNGKEITRHLGFWSKAEIVAQLKKMGIE